MNTYLTCCGVFACGVSIWLLARQLNVRHFRPLHLLKNKDGNSYSLNLVLVTPLYAALVCLIVELTLMLNVQIAVDYAAYASARSAAVWFPAEKLGSRPYEFHRDKVKLAAINAIAPFASARHKPSSNAVPEVFATSFADLYEQLGGQVKSRDYATKKYKYAAAATRIECTPSIHEARLADSPDVEVTVTYDMPFQISPIGRLLGQKKNGRFVREVSSTVRMKLQRPASKYRERARDGKQDRDGTLGIPYDSRPTR